VLVCFQLLEGIVRPLQSAQQTSAIQRSKLAADVVLRAKHQAPSSSNGSVNEVVADGNQLPSVLSPSSSKMTSLSTSGSSVCSSDSEEARMDKNGSLLHGKMELDANASSATDAKITVDMNENVVTSRKAPSHDKSCEISQKAVLTFTKPSEASSTPLPSSSTAVQNVSTDVTLAEIPSSQTNTSAPGGGTTDSTSSRAGTRSWVSPSNYRQKLGSQAASRYQSVTSRLYGDDFFGNLSNRVNRRPKSNTVEPTSFVAPVTANSSEESQSDESLTSKSTADNVASSVTVSGSNSVPAAANSTAPSSLLHFVYSCSTSKHSTVVRPSLTSESGEDDDDESVVDNSHEDDDVKDDDVDEAVDIGDAEGLQPKDGDRLMKKDVARWHQRLVVSPPPRRAAHAQRRFEDPDKELGAAVRDVAHGRSVQSDSATLKLPVSPQSPESSKHVSFDPFTLSLNAALEGELDVLQTLFSQVVLCIELSYF